MKEKGVLLSDKEKEFVKAFGLVRLRKATSK
jgi:hypothetical protein